MMMFVDAAAAAADDEMMRRSLITIPYHPIKFEGECHYNNRGGGSDMQDAFLRLYSDFGWLREKVSPIKVPQ
jgi:hypothetical protein